MYTHKKSLGQHFLKDEVVIKKIIEALQEDGFKNLLEVGPERRRVKTKYLMGIADINFKAVELDEEKVVYLSKKYPVLADKLIHQSFLDMDKPFDEPFTVIGNFPYNISTQILFKVLEWKDDYPVSLVCFRKKWRKSCIKRSKVYGVLSVLMQAYYEIEYLFDVGNECFDPPPKVQSGVIRMKRKTTALHYKSDRAFWVLVKQLNQRRKTMRNAVKSLFSAEELQDDIFLKRAEALSVEDFAALTFRMQ
ncbi:MAG: 16S rRNA (adenine(1518)-N(6)/adenine(1519)-N(6))-dimethyltransferase [Chitinophagaceae bacterium]|nr:16S rRNA (adenine(1518)-N(6)/adenine(1519)-N(6))-dimethyltransferase [Chitinophagaceae bacterium]